MNKEEVEKIVNDINDALWHLENNKCNIDTKENSWETYYGLNDELIRYIRKIEQENKQLKNKLIEINEVINGYMPNKYAMCKAFDEIEFIIKETLKEVE